MTVISSGYDSYVLLKFFPEATYNIDYFIHTEIIKEIISFNFTCVSINPLDSGE